MRNSWRQNSSTGTIWKTNTWIWVWISGMHPSPTSKPRGLTFYLPTVTISHILKRIVFLNLLKFKTNNLISWSWKNKKDAFGGRRPVFINVLTRYFWIPWRVMFQQIFDYTAGHRKVPQTVELGTHLWVWVRKIWLNSSSHQFIEYSTGSVWVHCNERDEGSNKTI